MSFGFIRHNHETIPIIEDSRQKNRELESCRRCSAFRGRKDGYGNLTVKKIPKAVLSRCEWGKDDYRLKVENLPKAPPPPGQMELILADRDGREEN
jgi:adenine-specific DNA-methyltransferase